MDFIVVGNDQCRLRVSIPVPVVGPRQHTTFSRYLVHGTVFRVYHSLIRLLKDWVVDEDVILRANLFAVSRDKPGAEFTDEWEVQREPTFASTGCDRFHKCVGKNHTPPNKLSNLQRDLFVDRFGYMVVHCQRQFERAVVEVNQRAISLSLIRACSGTARYRCFDTPACLKLGRLWALLQLCCVKPNDCSCFIRSNPEVNDGAFFQFVCAASKCKTLPLC